MLTGDSINTAAGALFQFLCRLIARILRTLGGRLTRSGARTVNRIAIRSRTIFTVIITEAFIRTLATHKSVSFPHHLIDAKSNQRRQKSKNDP